MTGIDFVETGDLTADGFDDCIIGVARVLSDGKVIRRVIYSANLMVNKLAKEFASELVNEQEAKEAASEFLDYNTFYAYVGPNTPMYLWDEEAEA